MKTFRLLGGVSLAAALLCAVPAIAKDVSTPLLIIDEDEVESLGANDPLKAIYFSPSLTALGGSSYVIEGGIGAKFRGIGDPRLNVSIEGSGALYQPGSVGELWAGSRVGFVLDEISKIEIVGNGAVGLIGGTPSYRFGVGGEMPIFPNTELFVEASFAGHFGFAPTDNGIRGGVHFYPFGNFDTGRDIFGSSFVATDLWFGGLFTAVPSASVFASSADIGLNFLKENGLVPGLRGSVGYQHPTGAITFQAGGQLGFQATPQFQPYVFADVGAIGSFPINVVGGGAEFKVDQTWGINGEAFIRGGLGAFTEGGFKLGARWHSQPTATLGARYRW